MQDPRKILKNERGPFDIIGDIHGCFDELTELLDRLGYTVSHIGEDEIAPGFGGYTAEPPKGRKAIFLGDLTGRGPGIAETLQLVMNMVSAQAAICVPGNHDIKLLRKLQGKPIEVKRGLAESLDQVNRQSADFRRRVMDFFESIMDHYVLDKGRLVVAHAGMPESMQGETSMEVREFALFGKRTGEVDEHGYAIRYDWASDYKGSALVVYGHTPMKEPRWVHNTVNVDTGCIFGGHLTALRYPEKEIVSVPARKLYWPGKPMAKSV